MLEDIGNFIVKGCTLPLEVLASSLQIEEDKTEEKPSQIHGCFYSRKPIQVADE